MKTVCALGAITCAIPLAIKQQPGKLTARTEMRERFAVTGIQVAPLKLTKLGEFQKSERAKLAKAANIVSE